MARNKFLALVVVSVAGLACSKADRSTTTPAETSAAPVEGEHADAGHEGMHEHEGGEHGQHEHDFPAPVTTFHDTMAPLWHAEAGEARTTDTCAALDDMIAKAGAIGEADVPDKAVEQADAWKAAAGELVGKLEALKTTCADSPDGFDAGFHEVHEAFHVLVKLVGHEEKQ